MRHKKDNGSEYIKAYPKLKKWINQCIICGSVGYKPELPEILTSNFGNGEYPTFGAYNIRRYFQPLAVNEFGICEECQKRLNLREK